MGIVLLMHVIGCVQYHQTLISLMENVKWHNYVDYSLLKSNRLIINNAWISLVIANDNICSSAHPVSGRNISLDVSNQLPLIICRHVLCAF